MPDKPTPQQKLDAAFAEQHAQTFDVDKVMDAALDKLHTATLKGPKRPMPPGAWTLHFIGGSLEPTWTWCVHCPADWNKNGERYVLKSADEEKRLAVMELVIE